MSEWKNSIVTYIDLIGIKSAADETGSRGTEIMRRMHALAEGRMSNGMPSHDHCYVWNDSILLLSYLDSPYRRADETEILREADDLKKEIDQKCTTSYAIAVKGRVFPNEPYLHTPMFQGQIADQPRVVKLKASSYAMGNCFLIEAKLGKKLKMPWYVDSRIAKRLATSQQYSTHTVKMLPENKEREIYAYKGYLW